MLPMICVDNWVVLKQLVRNHTRLVSLSSTENIEKKNMIDIFEVLLPSMLLLLQKIHVFYCNICTPFRITPRMSDNSELVQFAIILPRCKAALSLSRSLICCHCARFNLKMQSEECFFFYLTQIFDWSTLNNSNVKEVYQVNTL